MAVVVTSAAFVLTAVHAIVPPAEPAPRPYLALLADEKKIDAWIEDVRNGSDSGGFWEAERDIFRLGPGAGILARRKLAVLLYDPDPLVRMRALDRTTGADWSKATDSVADVYRLLADPDDRVRAAAVARYSDPFGCSGDWIERALADPSALVRAEAARRKSFLAAKPAGATAPLQATLESSRTVFTPDEPVTLIFRIRNVSDTPRTLPAPACVRFGQPTDRAMRELTFPYVFVLDIDSPIVLAPGAHREFRVPLSSLVKHRGEALGKAPGLWRLDATYVEGKNDPQRQALGVDAGRPSPVARAFVTIECAPDIAQAFETCFAGASNAMNPMNDPSPFRELYRFIQPGDSHELIDGLFARINRQAEAGSDTKTRNYRISRDYVMAVPYAAGPAGRPVVARPPVLLRTPRPDPPKGLPLSDWVLANGSLMLKIEPASQARASGESIPLRVTLRNLDQIPMTLERPLTPVGKNALLVMTLCSDRERWTEAGERPLPESEGPRLADMLRRGSVTGMSYSFLSPTGDKHIYVSAEGLVTVTPLGAPRIAPAGASDTETVRLEPRQEMSFSVTVGGPEADRPFGHRPVPGTYRLAFSYTTGPWCAFSNTVTIVVNPPGAERPREVELSLRIKEAKWANEDPDVEILVKNVTGREIELTSRGFLPPWTVAKWFLWRVDGRQAKYSEHIAIGPDEPAQTRKLAPGESVAWGKIPLGWLTFPGEKASDRAIKDQGPHTITVGPSALWAGLNVTPGRLEIGAARTPSTATQPATRPAK